MRIYRRMIVDGMEGTSYVTGNLRTLIHAQKCMKYARTDTDTRKHTHMQMNVGYVIYVIL